MDVVNPMAEKQKAKGLVSLTTKSGEIMWVHLDIIKDEQWSPAIASSKASRVTLSLL